MAGLDTTATAPTPADDGRDPSAALSPGENARLVRMLAPDPHLDLVEFFNNDAGFAAVARAVQPLFHRDFECVIHLPPNPTRSYHGIQGLREAWLDWLTPWASYRNRLEELVEAPDGRVLMWGQVSARLDDRGPDVQHMGAAVWTVRDGKVAHVAFFADRDAAAEAVGLDAR